MYILIPIWLMIGPPIEAMKMITGSHYWAFRVRNNGWFASKFPNNQFSTSTASEILIGEGSAEEYVEQMTGGSSSLSVTLFDEVWQAPHGVKNWGEDVAGERDHGADGNGAETLLRDVASRSTTRN